MGTLAQSARENDGTPLNAVVVYDTFDSAISARQILEGRLLAPTPGWKIIPWRLDMLQWPPAAAAAARESEEAHMVLIAFRRVQSFLPKLVEWLELWAAGRQVRQAGVVLWNLDAPIQSRPGHCSDLRHFSHQQGLSLLCNECMIGTEDGIGSDGHR